MILNHAVFNAAKFAAYLKPKPYFVTVIRDPEARLQSALRYFQEFSSNDDFVAWLDEGNLTGHPHWYRYVNAIAYDLGYYEAGGTADADSESVKTWIMCLDEVFNYKRDKGLVMPLEWFDQGLILLRRALGLDENDLPYIIMKEGDTISGYSREAWKEPTDTQSEKLRAKASGVDSQLYKHFNATFWDAWHAAGSDAELAQLTSTSAALQDACESQDGLSCPIECSMDSVAFTNLLRLKQGKPIC